MKKILLFLLFIGAISFAQNKYVAKSGSINFEASVPAFEEVAAKNNSVTAILNTENGEIACLVFVKAFRFKNALMEEHFNENYAESDRFPKANFKGKILDFSNENMESNRQFSIIGELSFHGVTKTVEKIPARLETESGKILLTGSFDVLASDFNIEIPKIVKNKVSEKVSVRFDFEFQKK